MSNWQETNLGEICSDISYGYTASAKQDGIGPKFLRITDIVPDRINWQTVPFCEADTPTIEKYKLKNGDIVIARTGATTGYNKIIKNISHDAVYASYLIRYQLDETKAYPYYIGHILQSSNWYDYVDAIAGGSAQPGANAKQLASFEILLPPLPEQKAIASVLSSLDDKIDLLHRRNKTLESMAETLFRQWFVEEAQEEWEDGCLGDVIELFDHLRIPLSKMERDKKKNGQLYPYYGAAKVMDYINDYIFDGDYILLGEDGTVRTDKGYPVLQYANGKFWVNNHTHVIKAKSPYNNFFLWNYLSKKNIDEIITGAVQPKINQGNLKALDFPKFPEDLVKEFNERTESFFKKINQSQTQIHTLEKLRDTLLPKLMSGEVHVGYEK
jgi:type I restriction enzyme S subunit